MNVNPKISIVIPSYNKASHIRETLESIFSQNYPNLEVIIQDGASTDTTINIIKKYAKKYPKMLFWESRKDKGQGDAINTGLKKAKGDILTFINADDFYKNGSLAKVGKLFNENPKADWIVGEGDIVDCKGKKISNLVTIYKNALLKINCYQILMIVNYITQPSVFINKKAYEKFGPFIQKNRAVMEYELWLKLGAKNMPLVEKSCLSSFRLEEGSFSSSQYAQILKEDLKIVKKYTQNFLILFLHKLHNLGRVFLIKFK